MSSPTTGWHTYDGVADIYQRSAVPWFDELGRDLTNQACTNSPMTILDVGCGTGLAARHARHQLGPKPAIVGLDPSAALLAQARQLDAAAGVTIAYRQGKAEATGLGAGAFALVAKAPG